ncbi:MULTISPECIES: trehalose-phosphatase [Psychrobacter]|uniref:trehalose-phosphatase n=1 Tax=Psychrobacter TaxID=497 RepID=UPI000ED78D57|nr:MULTISPECIES: trehalose-phosphatase [Psychrobacter]HCN16899.1 trehalose-phosphatase [Psychrobacter sp.]
MTVAINPSISTPSYIPPNTFADYLSNQYRYCLFLDMDGTLADFTLNPKDSAIPNATLTLLQKIQNHGVNVAIVTGRSLDEAKKMLSPLQLPIAATHGLEIAFDSKEDSDNSNGNNSDHISVAHVDATELTTIRQRIIQSCLPYRDFTIESKPYSIALHYRCDPTLADAAYTIMSAVLNNHSNWTLKQGKYVWEIMPKGADKGTAILTLLKNMQASEDVRPIFIGDDITDEAGFIAVQDKNGAKTVKAHQKTVKGMGIKVGDEQTCAHYYVRSVHEVRVLLESFLSFCQTHLALPSDLADANTSPIKHPMRHVI